MVVTAMDTVSGTPFIRMSLFARNVVHTLALHHRQEKNSPSSHYILATLVI